MQTTEDTQILRYDNILVSKRGITEVHDKKVVLFVPSAEIDHVILKFGRSEHRPIVSLSIGIIMTLVGIYGLTYLILAPAGFRYETGMIVLGAISGTIIFDALKKRYFLEVYKIKGMCRLVFSKNAKLNDIQDFFVKIRAIYQHQITEDPHLLLRPERQ